MDLILLCMLFINIIIKLIDYGDKFSFEWIRDDFFGDVERFDTACVLIVIVFHGIDNFLFLFVEGRSGCLERWMIEIFNIGGDNGVEVVLL